MKKKSLITKFLLVGCLCFSLLTVSNAQTEVKFGIKAGFNASNLSGLSKFASLSNEDANIDISTQYKPGFHAGVVSQINLSTKFFLQPELLYSMLGTKVKGEASIGGESGSGSESTSLHYLQLPVYAGYKIPAGKSSNIILGVGPYIGYGIAGDDGTFGDDGIFKRFDFGASAMGGVQFNKFQITVGYDLGLTDLVDMQGWGTAKDLLGLSSISNRNFKASLAYFF